MKRWLCWGWWLKLTICLNTLRIENSIIQMRMLRYSHQRVRDTSKVHPSRSTLWLRKLEEVGCPNFLPFTSLWLLAGWLSCFRRKRIKFKRVDQDPPFFRILCFPLPFFSTVPGCQRSSNLDYLWMIAFTLICVPLARRPPDALNRWRGNNLISKFSAEEVWNNFVTECVFFLFVSRSVSADDCNFLTANLIDASNDLSKLYGIVRWAFASLSYVSTGGRNENGNDFESSFEFI